MDPFIGEVRTFPWSFAPRQWAMCNGALLAINQNQALFALLGTFYGGNGTTTFALPDLRGRAPIHAGTSGGQSYQQGQSGGSESVGLTVSSLPAHNHAIRALGGTPGDTQGSNTRLPATVGPFSAGGKTVGIYAADLSSKVTLASDSISSVGGGQAHNNMQPFLVVNFCIALQGIFPSRN